MTVRLVASQEVIPARDGSETIAPVYRAKYLGGLWGIWGPKGFVGCSAWTFAEAASRARFMNVVGRALQQMED